MSSITRNTLIAIVIGYAVGCTLATIANGQEYEVTVDDGTPLRGEGFQGTPPSYLGLLKVETSHSGDSLASGAFISDRLFLTCYHNVRGTRKGDRIGIHTVDGTVYWNTRVTHTHPKHDLALIYVDDPVVKYHRILKVMDTPYSLRDVAIMGFQPSKNAIVLHQGVPTGRRFGNTGVNYPVTIETTASIYQGMSGGPCIDASMSLVGVAVWGDARHSYVVMIKHVHSFLDSYTGPKGNLVDPWDFLPFDPDAGPKE